MGSILSNTEYAILQQDQIDQFASLLLSSLLVVLIIVFASSSSYLRRMINRFIRIQVRKRLIDPALQKSDINPFVSYYQNSLYDLQRTNNQLLGEILKKNHSCAFYVDRSISFLSSYRPSSAPSTELGYASIDAFREKIPLTTYDDYRNYIDRMVINGEKNLITSDNVVYFATSSGTTDKIKLVPVTANMLKQFTTLIRLGLSVIWRYLPSSSYPSAEQRLFYLKSGKKAKMFPRSKDGTPIGPLSQYTSVVPIVFGMNLVTSMQNVIALDLIEDIADFETSIFVQLVFALMIPDIFSYSVPFSAAFIHTIKLIENHVEEITLCISTANFDHSSLIRDNIHDGKLRATLNQALNTVALEYGGTPYRLERAEHIRKECLKKDVSDILHRLWPTLVFVCTATGSSFAMYKKEIEFSCGERLPVVNFTMYLASEGFFGSLISIYTDEYFPLPTCVFYEFIKEEDMHQTQPKTFLISEMEPGNRYELVCTTECGLVRYRMGDVIHCTRFLSRADDLVPLPPAPTEIPRIPLFSVAYRVGSLLDVFGEKTSEQHVMNALQQTVQQWRKQGISVGICDFTSYPKLDVFPPQYVIFLELVEDDNGGQIRNQHFQILQNSADTELERQLCLVNHKYKILDMQQNSGPLFVFLFEMEHFQLICTRSW